MHSKDKTLKEMITPKTHDSGGLPSVSPPCPTKIWNKWCKFWGGRPLFTCTGLDEFRIHYSITKRLNWAELWNLSSINYTIVRGYLSGGDDQRPSEENDIIFAHTKLVHYNKYCSTSNHNIKDLQDFDLDLGCIHSMIHFATIWGSRVGWFSRLFKS